MTPLISVIIPTYAPDIGRLERTLAALRRQTLPQPQWEVIIIDNASPEPVAAQLATRAHPVGRVLGEPRLGLTPARLAGIAAAKGAILVFVDDDNVLREDYLANASQFLEAHPGVAALGGQIRGEYACPPAPWARPHLWSLAVRDYGNQCLVSTYSATGPEHTWPVFCPIGAGLVVRAEAARRYLEHCASADALSDRCGDALGSAGDSELIMHAAFLAGAQVAYCPELQLTHLIPRRRLAFGYLTRLNYQGGVCWGKFLVAYGFQTRISRWSLCVRIPRAFFRRFGWTRRGFIAWASAAGEFIGRAA